MGRTARTIMAACAAFIACASAQAQEAQAGAGAQAVAIVGGGGGGGTQRVHTTPDAIAPGIVPTAPCIAVYSAGVSITGFGAALGGGVTDHICQGANLAAVAAQVGRQDIADVALEIALGLYIDATTPRAVPARIDREDMR
jgi:hypothetical protein